MVFNKYVMFVLTALGVIVPAFASLHWVDIVGAQTAAVISLGSGVVLAIVHALAPPPGSTITTQPGNIITHG